jgi:hypothetical protein
MSELGELKVMVRHLEHRLAEVERDIKPLPEVRFEVGHLEKDMREVQSKTDALEKQMLKITTYVTICAAVGSLIASVAVKAITHYMGF